MKWCSKNPRCPMPDAHDGPCEVTIPRSLLRHGIRAPVVLKGLLPFRRAAFHPTSAEWMAEPQEPFRPRGLLIWDAPAGAVVDLILIGATPQLVATIGDLPARWFATADSYEQVWKAHLEGKDPPGWGDFQIVPVGMWVRVRMYVPTLAGPREVPEEEWARVQLLMWGERIH